MLGAILGAGAISGLGSFFGGKAQGDAASAAAAAERKRLAQLKPYVEAGKEALPQFQAGIEDIPDMASLLNFVRADPSYQFQLGQGMNALEGSAAARGKLLSGDTLKAINQYGQGLASQYTDTIMNRALNLQGAKQNQLATLLQGGLNAAGAQSQLPQILMQGGAAKAGMYQGLGNAATSTLGNVLLNQYLGG